MLLYQKTGPSMWSEAGQSQPRHKAFQSLLSAPAQLCVPGISSVFKAAKILGVASINSRGKRSHFPIRKEPGIFPQSPQQTSFP